MILNLEARLKYAEARNFAIKKMKKIMAKQGLFKELYLPSTVDPEIVRRQAAVYGKFDARMVPVQPNGSVLTGPDLDNLETHSAIFYGTEIAKQFDIRFYEERNDEHTYPTIMACTLAAFPRFLKPLTRGWTLNV